MVVEEGDTVIEAPVPAAVTPQPPVYQFHEAPDPNEPPDTVSVVELPGQIGLAVALIPVGVVELANTVIVTLFVAMTPHASVMVAV